MLKIFRFVVCSWAVIFIFSESNVVGERLCAELNKGEGDLSKIRSNLDFAGRHRHRHRTHHRRIYPIEGLSEDAKSVDISTYRLLQDQISELDLDLDNVKNQFTIMEMAKMDNVSLSNKSKKYVGVIKSKEAKSRHLERVKNSIFRVLKFIGSHLDACEINKMDVALVWTKIYDDKHGAHFQKTFPLADWINKICLMQENSLQESLCRSFESNLKLRSVPRYPENILLENGVKVDSLGKEKETIQGVQNAQCQGELLLECKVSKECEDKYFSLEPSTQYMLTHQLLQRIFAESKNCSVGKRYLDESVNHRLCSKMYLEAELVSKLNYTESLRDLFAEYVGFCGYMGYPNFYREDWLHQILSWQSKSQYGCFSRGKDFQKKFITTDTPFIRKQTKAEIKVGSKSEEMCWPHFTSSSLMALVGFWDYLQD